MNIVRRLTAVNHLCDVLDCTTAYAHREIDRYLDGCMVGRHVRTIITAHLSV